MTQSINQLHQESSGLLAKEGKYLTFILANEGYGLEILKVKEIIGIMNITPIPQTPAYMKGVINLRGRVIPVIDLRLKFDMPAADYTDHTCIIVVEVENGENRAPMGVVVDSVSEVLNIGREDLEPPPSFGVRLQSDYLLGLAKTKGGVKILLDLQQVLTSAELLTLEKMAA